MGRGAVLHLQLGGDTPLPTPHPLGASMLARLRRSLLGAVGASFKTEGLLVF